VVALNYGSQMKSPAPLPRRLRRARSRRDSIEAELDTAGLPPLDLLIRTSGEVRLSNFLLWQAAYAEMWFTDVLWPDFTPEHLRAALAEFAGRERRYGGR
jgi:undecaprenyl diphosphate synthase